MDTEKTIELIPVEESNPHVSDRKGKKGIGEEKVMEEMDI